MKRTFFGHVILLSLALCWSGACAETGERERAFLKALEAYDHAKTPDEFRTVAAAFEALVAPEYQNDAVYYNLGNARMKAGEYGRAILAYRKASLMRPRDPWLEANLKQALNGAPGRLPAEPAAWWRTIFFWSGWLSYAEKFQLALAAWTVCVLALAGAMFWRSGKLRWTGVVAGLFAVLFSIDASVAYQDLFHSGRGVVVVETQARKGNGLNWEPAFDQPLKDGAEFTIIDRRGDWVHGVFNGIGDGWLPSTSVAE
jgi:tetratricopeptide (TPR) repeat protein